MAGGVAAGGQLTTTTEIENFPSHISINGSELMDLMRKQNETYGGRITTEVYYLHCIFDYLIYF
jgi:thioredoxin reductase (NADPH)